MTTTEPNKPPSLADLVWRSFWPPSSQPQQVEELTPELKQQIEELLPADDDDYGTLLVKAQKRALLMPHTLNLAAPVSAIDAEQILVRPGELEQLEMPTSSREA
jgi:hypothetical protein